MRCLLDTSICVELIRGRSAELTAKLKRRTIGSVGISSITLAELQCGVAKSSDPARNTIALAHMVAPLAILPFDDQAAATYGRMRADLERAGQRIGSLDMLIAAHALALGLTLVTNNEREFCRVPALTVENWLSAS